MAYIDIVFLLSLAHLPHTHTAVNESQALQLIMASYLNYLA